MTVDTYARIAGRLYALPESRHAEVFTQEGVSRAAWEAAWPVLAPRLSEDPAAYARYSDGFRAGMEREVGVVRDLTEEEYIAAEVARRLEREAPVTDLGPAAFLVARYRFVDRLNASKREAGRIEAAILLSAQAAAGRYEVRPLPPPALANRVRARRCPACDAPKHTRARTPHVYCDFCGHLMDYDHEAARVRTHGLDPAFVTGALIDAVRDELRASFEVDDAAWADAWRWVYRTDMALCPDGWSPRIRQDDYREALIEWSVATCRVANDPAMKAANEAARGAFDEGMAANSGWGDVPEKRRRRAVERHLQLADAALAVELRLYETHDLFETHPDRLTPDTWRRVHRGGLVDQWRPWLDDAMLAIVRAHVDGQEAWLDIPPPPVHRATCGGCGGRLVVVDGAQAVVCEACGLRLDAARPRFPCPTCRAEVVVAPSAHEIACGHCGVAFLPG